ncbi:MAG: PEGA domain-containing protein [Vicinamibacterales bacterium]
MKPAVTLRVESDVPGAMIFLDRQYLGTAPVETSEVAPGAHTVNASAEGYPGIVEKVEVKEGSNELTVRFRVVRLNEAIAVVHKHTFGSCEGRLLADTSGIRYDTTNKDDRFSVPFDRLETFEVDYLEKNLKLKIRGGKSYNFTDRNNNADALFVFHKNVQEARARLARGDAPAK